MVQEADVAGTEHGCGRGTGRGAARTVEWAGPGPVCGHQMRLCLPRGRPVERHVQGIRWRHWGSRSGATRPCLQVPRCGRAPGTPTWLTGAAEGGGGHRVGARRGGSSPLTACSGAAACPGARCGHASRPPTPRHAATRCTCGPGPRPRSRPPPRTPRRRTCADR